MAKNPNFKKNILIFDEESQNISTDENKNNIKDLFVEDKNIFDFTSMESYLEDKKSFNIKKKEDLCEDIEINKIPLTLEEIEMQIDRLKQRWGEVTYLIGERLKYINDNRLYEEKGYADFRTYVRYALKMSENNAYYYITVCEYFTPQETRLAGSKLKLIIPILNKIKKDTTLSDEIKEMQLQDLKTDLINKISTKTYREAEKFIIEIKENYFETVEEILNKDLNKEKILILKDKIVIKENNREIQLEIVKLIENFYNNLK